MKKQKIHLFLLLIGTLFNTTHAADIYVSTKGSNQNNGSKEKPFATLATAQKKARDFTGKESVTIHIEDGVYYLSETLIFTSEDSGSEQYPIIYKSQTEGGAILSGGSKLNLKWKRGKNGISVAKTPKGLKIDQLFIDGKNQRMARYPNYNPAKKAEPYQGFSADAFSTERASKWANPKGGYIHAMHRKQWGGYHYLITGKNPEGDITYEGGWQNNRKTKMHERYRMVENIFEELDTEGEWYHNAKENKLYFKAAANTKLNKVKVEVVRLRHIVEFKGTETNPVKNITFQGFVVRHTARTFMDVKEPLLRSDWAIYRGGAFLLTGTEQVKILDTEFDQVGGNAIFVNNYNRNVLIKGCHIHDAGASGVCFVGDPNAVRNPLFEYREKNDLSKIDLTPGPKTNNYPANSIVEDCLIHGIGRTERQPAGVQISMSMGITVRDVSIYDCARAGINISEGTWGGHLIEGCDVFDTVLETHDHGSFNSWGRDRYWSSNQKESQKAVDKNPELPFLDAVKTSTIRNSRWRCDHGWDIDLDDGSSNYDIYNNLLLNHGLKLREGFRRHVWNNITWNSGLHPHVWYQGSKDQVHNNIFMASHRFARMSEPYIINTSVDRNFYAASQASIMRSSSKAQWDTNSKFGDPMFIDPAKGNFHVNKNSPALKIGFKNFPMDQFGVKKPSLKAIARTPEVPELGTGKKKKGKKKQPQTSIWLGATINNLKGEEFSAYGVTKKSGGVAFTNIPKNSKAATTGLLEGDLVQEINDKTVSNIVQFSKIMSTTTSKSLKLKVIRDQEEISIKIKQ